MLWQTPWKLAGFNMHLGAAQMFTDLAIGHLLLDNFDRNMAFFLGSSYDIHDLPHTNIYKHDTQTVKHDILIILELRLITTVSRNGSAFSIIGPIPWTS